MNECWDSRTQLFPMNNHNPLLFSVGYMILVINLLFSMHTVVYLQSLFAHVIHVVGPLSIM